MRMDLSAEDCQDQGQHRQQVHLSPKLHDAEGTRQRFSQIQRADVRQTLTVCSYSITVESVEDPRYITAEDAHRDAGVVQGEPAPARLL